MWIRWLPVSSEEKYVLSALVQGAYLKAHRYLDGKKVHILHCDECVQAEVIADNVIDRLLERKFIRSNLKFPAATYVLTEAGSVKGSSFVQKAFSPVTSH